MKRILHIATPLLATLPFLTLSVACGGGGGGGDEAVVAASSTQVAQAVLVASAAITSATGAAATSTGSVTTSSVASASVHGAAMAMGPGTFDLPTTDCGTSGTMAMHAQWTDLNETTSCVDGLVATLDFAQCADAAAEPLDGTLGMTVGGSSCNPTAITMDFSGVTVTVPDGTLSGDFTLGMSGMAFAGDPANLDITAATLTLNGRMEMAGSGFGTLDMGMDHLVVHFDDATSTGDLNGTLTVHCNGQAFPMILATDTNGLTYDADGNTVGGHMTVTAEGTPHQVTFNADGSLDVTPAGGTPVHFAEPAATEFCAL